MLHIFLKTPQIFVDYKVISINVKINLKTANYVYKNKIKIFKKLLKNLQKKFTHPFFLKKITWCPNKLKIDLIELLLKSSNFKHLLKKIY